MAKLSLRDQISQRTKQNIVKGRSGSSKTTYLDRFVDALTDEKGEPIEPINRTDLIAAISLSIVEEKIEAQVEAGRDLKENPFELTPEMNSEDDLLVADVNRKVRSQVANAVAKNNNSTSLSYNEKYKDKYEVIKGDGNTIGLALKAKK